MNPASLLQGTDMPRTRSGSIGIRWTGKALTIGADLYQQAGSPEFVRFEYDDTFTWMIPCAESDRDNKINNSHNGNITSAIRISREANWDIGWRIGVVEGVGDLPNTRIIRFTNTATDE